MKYLLGIMLFLVLGIWFTLLKPIDKKTGLFDTEQFPTPTTIDIKEVLLYAVKRGQGVTLIPNFSEQLSSQKIAAMHSCTFVTNGGFYTKENMPLGLFAVQGKIYGKQSASATFNGFLYKTNERFAIAPDAIDDPDWILQSGPILVLDGKPRVLRLTADEQERRSVAAITTEGELVFVSMLSFLKDLPQSIATQVPNIKDAINLDGGTSSVFLSPQDSLVELKPAGSFFCVM